MASRHMLKSRLTVSVIVVAVLSACVVCVLTKLLPRAADPDPDPTPSVSSSPSAPVPSPVASFPLGDDGIVDWPELPQEPHPHVDPAPVLPK